MTIPKLDITPKYNLVIPSTGEKVKYRPYLVKEEKLLLLALEDNDPVSTSEAVIELIKACVDKDLDEKNLTTFDMDYLFCQIRAKSVGENVDLSIECEAEGCDHVSSVPANISKASIDMSLKNEKMIKITDSISVEMKYLSYYDYLRNADMAEDESEATLVFHSILRAINAIHTDEERIDVKNEPIADLENFVDSLNSSQYAALKTFIARTPKVSLDVNWSCEKCNLKQTMKLEGLDDFFH